MKFSAGLQEIAVEHQSWAEAEQADEPAQDQAPAVLRGIPEADTSWSFVERRDLMSVLAVELAHKSCELELV